MSLDVHLLVDEPVMQSGTGVYVRDGGSTRELSPAEVAERWPDSRPEAQALKTYDTPEVFHANVTHNLNTMAETAGLYTVCWHPETMGWTHAGELIPALEQGLAKLKADPVRYKQFNPENGWGNYDLLVEFVTDYLDACRTYPQAKVEVST